MSLKDNLLQNLQNKKRLETYNNDKYRLQNQNNDNSAMYKSMQQNTQEIANKGWTGNKYATGLFDEGSKGAASSGNMWAAIASAIYETGEGIYDMINANKIANIKNANLANMQEQQINQNDYNNRLNALDSMDNEALQRQQMDEKAKVANTLDEKLNARLMPQSNEQFGQELAQKNEQLMQNDRERMNQAEENRDMKNEVLKKSIMDVANSAASAYGSSKGGSSGKGSSGESKEVSGQIIGSDGAGISTDGGTKMSSVNANSYNTGANYQQPQYQTQTQAQIYNQPQQQYQPPQQEYQTQDYQQTPQQEYDKNIIARMLERIRGGKEGQFTDGAASPQMTQTADATIDSSESQYPLPKTNKLSELFNRQKQNVYPEGNGNKVLPDYQGNTQSENPIIAYQNSLRDSGNYTDAEIAGVAQGLNSGRPEIQQWLNQFNNGAGKNKPIRIPQTAEEIALAREGKFNEIPQEGNVTLNRGGTLKERLLNGVKDLSAGYKENSTTPFAVENLQGVQGKSKMNKLGEALGTTSRLLANPYMQGLIAGGIYKATGGDLGESINYGVNWAQNKSKSDYYAKKMGQTPGVFANNFDANDYKVYENELYHQQQLENELAKLNEQERYHNLTFEQKERQMYLNNEIQKSKLRLQVVHENNYQRKIDNEIKNGTKGSKGTDFDWSKYFNTPEDYAHTIHLITMDEGDPDFENAVNEETNSLMISDPSFAKLSDEQKRKKAVAVVKKDQQERRNIIKYNTGKDIAK